jgi:hypothetical protein
MNRGDSFVNKRGLLTVGAALLTGAAAALAVPSIAGALATGSATHATLPGAGMAGVLMARGSGRAEMWAAANAAGRAAAASAASCTEPDCNMTYHGGPVQHTPRAYLVFWGPKWSSTTNTAAKTAKSFVTSFYKGLGAGADDWSRALSQYTDKTGHPVFGTALLAGSRVDASTPPKSVTMTNLQNEAIKAARAFKIKDVKNAEIVIVSQSGTCFQPTGGLSFAGNCGKLQTSGYCAWHSAAIDWPGAGQFLPYVNLPFQPDAGQGCGQGFIPGDSSPNVGFSITGGHETAETISDPALNAWFDFNDAVSGGEVADKCAWGGQIWGDNDPSGNVKLTTGSFPMQSLWSNAINGCVMAGKLKLFVNTPAAQQVLLGKGVSVQIHATLNGRAALKFTALKLPAGLTIGAANGKITGKPAITAGAFAAKIRVSYYDGSATIIFPFQISSVAGQVTGIGGKCADVLHGATANGTAIDISTCTGNAQQKITFAANGQLQVLGKCIAGGGSAVLATCSTTASQVWTRRANGEYVLKSNGHCLTDPHSSTSNGTKLTLAACANTANQQWSLP